MFGDKQNIKMTSKERDNVELSQNNSNSHVIICKLKLVIFSILKVVEINFSSNTISDKIKNKSSGRNQRHLLCFRCLNSCLEATRKNKLKIV
jgi:hypothetical protein